MLREIVKTYLNELVILMKCQIVAPKSKELAQS
jgi:hypothetical protein